MGKIICPICGSEVVLPETSEVVTGITFSEQSNGTHYLNMKNVKENKNVNKAEERIATLKANGVDTSKYFALADDVLVRMENGNPIRVDLDEEYVAAKIEDEGDVFNSRLDGRWIMAQMFHMLKGTRPFRNFGNVLGQRGYSYQWSMLTDEFHRMNRRQRDGEDLSIKRQYFNKELVIAMIDDYVKKLELFINSCPTKYCGADRRHGITGSPYKRLGDRYKRLTKKDNGDIFERDIPKLLNHFASYKSRATHNDYYKLSNLCKEFRKDMIELPWHTPMCKQFVDSYKGNGAYYTCNNLIRFHECTVPGMNKTDSLKELDKRCQGFGTGWIVFGFMRDLIADNHFSFG